MVVVLGIDPGTANTGYGVVLSQARTLAALDGGTIQTTAHTPIERRLAHIHGQVGELIAEHQPDAMAIEQLYFGANAQSAFAVGQARGVVLLAAGSAGVPCFSYTPQQIKQAVCGSGRAAKDQVQRMVGTLLSLPEPPEPDHAADALAVGICHANGAPLKTAVGAATSHGRRPSTDQAGMPDRSRASVTDQAGMPDRSRASATDQAGMPDRSKASP